MRFDFKSFLIKLIYVLIDLFWIYAAIVIACLLRQSTTPYKFSFFNIVSEQNPYQAVLLIWIIITIFIFKTNRLYLTKREFLSGFEFWLVVKSVIFSSVLSVVVVYGLKIQGFPRSIFLIGTALNVFFLSGWRILKRIFVNYLVVNGYNNFNVLILGAGNVGILVKKEIEKHPELGLKVVGFLDDLKSTDSKNSDIKILGKVSSFSRIAKKEFINKVFLTFHHDYEPFLRILEQAKQLGIAVRVIPQGFELISSEFSKFNVGIIPVLEYSEVSPLKRQFGKRVFDLVASFFGALLLSPFFILIALCIKKDSQGPVFYKSKRYGYNGKIFYMYKFRSMVCEADNLMDSIKDKNEKDGPIFKIKNDPRITRVGRFLRKYSIDELPQILNVLKGDMSLVGPRPLPIQQVEKEDLKQLKRLEVRPGITGLWQIKGRSDISFARLVRWDTWYINNWSFWLDVTILLQTIPVVIKGKGAY